MKNKKSIAAALVLSGVLVVGGVLAYFTDTDTATNTFTVGRVDIALNEEHWDATATAVNQLAPQTQIAKDPTVENTGVNSAYVFLKVEVPYASVKLGKSTTATPTELFSYTINSTDWEEVTSLKTTGTDKVTHVYAYKNASGMKTLAAGATTSALFSNVTFADVADPADLSGFVDGSDTKLNIVVTAYGIQSDNIAANTAPATIFGNF